MDFSQNEKMEPGNFIVNCILVVCFRYMVRLGLLFLYQLALECEKTPGLSRYNKLVCPVSCAGTNWFKVFFKLSRCGYCHCVFYKPWFKCLAEHKGSAIEKAAGKLNFINNSSLCFLFSRVICLFCML